VVPLSPEPTLVNHFSSPQLQGAALQWCPIQEVFNGAM
jgi:hypothetical protein